MSPVSQSRNDTSTIAVKNYAKVDIKVFYSPPVLLDFSIFCQT